MMSTRQLKLLLFALSLLISFSAHAAGLTTNKEVDTSGVPRSVVLGDLNGDSTSDLITKGEDNGVSVLLGEVDTSGVPRSVALGDVNGDGVNDLITTNCEDNSVSVLLGKGNGIFQTKMNYATGTYPFAVALGDLNGDQVNDVVTVNLLDHSVSVLIGNGDGSFKTRTDYQTAKYPISVTLGDLNDDGMNDLAIANYSNNNINILHGNGDGSFFDNTLLPITPSTTKQPKSITNNFYGHWQSSPHSTGTYYGTNDFYLDIKVKKNGSFSGVADVYLRMFCWDSYACSYFKSGLKIPVKGKVNKSTKQGTITIKGFGKAGMSYSPYGSDISVKLNNQIGKKWTWTSVLLKHK